MKPVRKLTAIGCNTKTVEGLHALKNVASPVVDFEKLSKFSIPTLLTSKFWQTSLIAERLISK